MVKQKELDKLIQDQVEEKYIELSFLEKAFLQAKSSLSFAFTTLVNPYIDIYSKIPDSNASVKLVKQVFLILLIVGSLILLVIPCISGLMRLPFLEAGHLLIIFIFVLIMNQFRGNIGVPPIIEQTENHVVYAQE